MRIKNLLIMVFCTAIVYTAKAQSDSILVKPILMNKSVLSGVGLKKVDLKDEPEKDFYQRKLFGGDEISVYVVSTETWNNKIANYGFDEYVYLIHGQSIVKPLTGNTEVFQAGDHLFVPRGFKGEWEIRAGNNLHYELAVITSERADSTKVKKEAKHKNIDRTILSGCQITLEEGNYEEVLQEGAELKITLKAQRPSHYEMEKSVNEQLINVLSGQITISDEQNNKYTFYTGDFVVLPKNLIGKWKSEGHGMVKYLVVEKAK